MGLQNIASLAITMCVIYITHGAPSLLRGKETGKCRCVPKQWHGLLQAVEHEFDLTGDTTATTDTRMYVNYDYHNEIVTLKDMKSGSVSISDYAKHKQLFMSGDLCQAMELRDRMNQMCLPDDAEYLGDYKLSMTNVDVELWSHVSPHNVTMKTTVLKAQCMPITEEGTVKLPGYASVTTNNYLDARTGPHDDGLYGQVLACLQKQSR